MRSLQGFSFFGRIYQFNFSKASLVYQSSLLRSVSLSKIWSFLRFNFMFYRWFSLFMPELGLQKLKSDKLKLLCLVAILWFSLTTTTVGFKPFDWSDSHSSILISPFCVSSSMGLMSRSLDFMRGYGVFYGAPRMVGSLCNLSISIGIELFSSNLCSGCSDNGSSGH